MNGRLSRISSLAVIALCLPLYSGITAEAQEAEGALELIPDVKHDISPPLLEIEPIVPAPRAARVLPLRRRSLPLAEGLAPGQPDPVLQTSSTPLVGVLGGLNLLGLGKGFTGPQGSFSVNAAPPDSNGSVGATQFVEWVNAAVAVFDKASGSVLLGPIDAHTLWSGFGGACQTDDDGDGLVQYDKAAQRWVISQFAVTGGPPFFECVAVSTSSDATGSYFRYAFQFSNFNDYPKMGVWPDAYYLSFNMFDPTGTFFLGARACALDRNMMLAGAPTTMVCFQRGPAIFGLLPSDLDGATPPPPGSPNFFLRFAANALQLFKFHVDFANPSNSSFAGPVLLAVAPFTPACGGGTCIPQAGAFQRLDSLADRLMYRLAYRNFGNHESLVVNHSVTTGLGNVGVRWYEIQNPGTTPVVHQQGTYSPDGFNFRWMGSVAMDKVSDIALGYSISSRFMHPSIRITGRVPTDRPGTMETEGRIFQGSGSQTFGLSRWGDYTSMAIDPVDDCTFWYTNQYLQSNGSFNWSTRIGSFKFPSCK